MTEARADFELQEEGSVKDVKDASTTSRQPTEAAAKDESPITASLRQGELIFLMVRVLRRDRSSRQTSTLAVASADSRSGNTESFSKSELCV